MKDLAACVAASPAASHPSCAARRALAVGLLTVAMPRAQTTVEKIANYADDSIGAVVTDGATTQSFYLEIASRRTRLWIGGTHSDDAAARRVAKGSEAARDLFARLHRWRDRAFPQDWRAWLSTEHPRQHPESGDRLEWARYLEAQLLRGMHRFEELGHATLTDITAERGGVLGTFRIELPSGDRWPVAIRRFGEDAIPRLQVGPDDRPIAIGSNRERDILTAVVGWSERTDGGRHLLAVQKAVDAYLAATSPRLAAVFALRNGGSLHVELRRADGTLTRVEFDHALDSKTPGRIHQIHEKGSELVALGSETERRLLELLDRWVALVAAGRTPATPSELTMIRDAVASYRKDFVQPGERKQDVKTDGSPGTKRRR